MADETCAACGHDRVFHRVGTGNGVPEGKEFCDDRYADPCDCTGFVARPPIETLAREIAAHGSCPDSMPLRQALAITGAWRVYFNRDGAIDLPWCVAPDRGGWEIAVREVKIETPAVTVHQPKATPDEDDGKPSAWIAVTGVLRVGPDGRASIGAAS